MLDLTGFLYEGSWSPLVRTLLPYLDASMMKYTSVHYTIDIIGYVSIISMITRNCKF